jgi:hypothetical protein
MDFRHMTAPCGLDCFNCPVYLANDDEKMRAIVSEKTGIPLEQAVCKGCRGESGKCPGKGKGSNLLLTHISNVLVAVIFSPITTMNQTLS